jgi:hypothetical protein
MRIAFTAAAALTILFVMTVLTADAQTPRRRTSTPIPAPTATPSQDAAVISRADDFLDENTSRAIPPDPNEARTGADRANVQSLEDLGKRIKNLESAQVQKGDPDAKPKRLLLNLDILTRAEQRSESLRRQIFELMEKETTYRTRIDAIEYDLRPEAIERHTAITGSLRPEELRATRKKVLESERTNLQNLITEIQRTKTTLEQSLQRSEALIEKLRTKLEGEIDTALEDEPQKPDQ